MTTDELRETYLDFFAGKGCERRPSDVLVPKDPTVLFTPAGMNQFKREFLGLGDPNFKRATTCQKCLRTGDIDNVGKTAFHATFFEMLGLFSFGDFFKREAIHWHWELLTKRLKYPKDRLTVTVYLDDDEAYNIWRDEIGLSPDRIQRMGEDDNFWPAGAPTHGPNGVCGPCSEIFYHGEGATEVEIGNLVFTQFNRTGPGQLEPLPKKNIDVGLGLERNAACLQGVGTMFDLDIFRPIVAAAAEALGVDYEKARHSADGIRIRRMSDHARALMFCIHENVRPGPEKQGYVIRRLLRRAVLDAYQMGRREPFLSRLIPDIAEVMSRAYPELRESVPRVQTTVRQEEERFLSNLENGLGLLAETFRKTKASGSDVVSGKEAFTLHETYGIPIEVTESLAAEQNLTIDQAGFKSAQARHSKVSRGTAGAADVFKTGPLDTLRETYHHGSEFLGYETTQARGRVVGIVEQGKLADSAEESAGGPPIALILDRSPFYAESGGQIGDVGELRGDGWVFRVDDTQRDTDFILHIGHVVSGKVVLGASATAEVDAPRRQAIRRAHSATHVLHHALHVHLGKHAQQAGSKVEPDRLRFDFANPTAVGKERLREIEQTVNDQILAAHTISWSTMPIATAKEQGAMALFGEKYPEMARVVAMGDFSRELCGGTHLDNTAHVGLFKIVSEESVAAGTRRISALTGKAALEYVAQEEEALGEIAAALRVPPCDCADRVAALLDDVKSLKRQASQRKAETGPKTSPDELLAGAKHAGDLLVVAAALENANPDEMRQLIDVLKRKQGSALAVMLVSTNEGKVQLAAGFTEDLLARGFHAGQWLKEIAPIVGGGGGGRPDLAQAGGKDPSKVAEALEKAVVAITAKL